MGGLWSWPSTVVSDVAGVATGALLGKNAECTDGGHGIKYHQHTNCPPEG